MIGLEHTRLLLLLGLPGAAHAWDNGLALTPPRGFATWNIWPFTDGVNRTCNPPTCTAGTHIMRAINESQCRHLAQALLDTGLAGTGSAGGFDYFVVQEPCFSGRDNKTGELLETGGTDSSYEQRWPQGMKSFGDWLHDKGMKLGIYTDIGSQTCGRCVGSGSGATGHVAQDMKTFASWGADLIEVDACGGPIGEPAWREYRDAINATGRPMVHSICAEGYDHVWTWGMETGNMWRVAGDIQDGWLNVLRNVDQSAAIPGLEQYSGRGGWNDLDMLEIGGQPGNYSWGGPGLNLAEARTHFTLWSILKSPLLLGADASRMSPQIISILADKELRAIAEDELGKQAVRLDLNYPGFHAADASERAPTQLTLRPCDDADSQQLWGGHYASAYEQGGFAAALPDAFTPKLVNLGYCVSAPECGGGANYGPENAARLPPLNSTQSSYPLTLRQCQDWNVDPCTGFSDQVFYARGGASSLELVSNLTQINGTGSLCVTHGGVAGGEVNLSPCAAGAAPGAAQRWSIASLAAFQNTSADSHPDRPGELIQAGGGLCLSTNFSVAERNEVYVGELSGGRFVVAFLNRTPLPREMSVDLRRIGFYVPGAKRALFDVWTKKSIFVGGGETLRVSVAPHDTALYVVGPAPSDSMRKNDAQER